MNTWWCAIDRTWCAYDELKRRKVVAQGWPGLGDLRSLLKFLPGHEEAFKLAIQQLGDVAYSGHDHWDQNDRRPTRAPAVFWALMRLQRGDLVVGLEGRKVRGICQLPSRARVAYGYDDRFHYAQGVGPVEWVDWDSDRFGFEPTAPAQSVHGIKRLAGEHDAVLQAWQASDLAVTPVPEYWVNIDIPTRTCVMHKESCEHVGAMKPTGLKGKGELLQDGGWFLFGNRGSASAHVRRFVEVRGQYEKRTCSYCH